MKRYLSRRLLLSTFTSTAAVLLFAGCGGQSATNTADSGSPSPSASSAGGASKGTIGVSLLTSTNPFFSDMGKAIGEEAKANGMEATIVSADNDPAKQKDQVNDFIVKKVSAIILNPADSKSIGEAIKAANDAGIPVFTADIASLSKDAKVVSHVATDNLDGGKLAGQAMIDALKGKGKVAILDHPEAESVIQRTKGFEEVINAHNAKGRQNYHRGQVARRRRKRQIVQSRRRYFAGASRFERHLRHQRSFGAGRGGRAGKSR